MLFQYCFSEYGKLCGCIKLDFLDCLGSIDKPTYINPEIDASIIDGPALVQMNHPESSLKAFGSYCEVQLVNKVNSFFQNTNYISIAFNMYQENSLKNDTLKVGIVERVRRHLHDMTNQFSIKNSKIF